MLSRVREISVVGLLFLSVLGVSGCQSGQGYAAKVNGEVIPQSAVEQNLHALTTNQRLADVISQGLGGEKALRPGGANTLSSSFTSNVLLKLIVDKLVAKEIEARHITVTDQQRKDAENQLRSSFPSSSSPDPAMFDSLANNYKRDLINSVAARNALSNANDTPGAQQRYYDEHKRDFTQYCVRHILVPTRDEAAAIKQRIIGGEDFAAIAKSSSKDNAQGGSAEHGGDLGCASETQLDGFVKEFADAVRLLQVNQVSDPVQTEYGFHVIQVTKRETKTLDQARSEISGKLRDQSTILLDLIGKAKIKVKPSYGDYQPGNADKGQSPSIQPHQPPKLNEGDPNNGANSSPYGDLSSQQ